MNTVNTNDNAPAATSDPFQSALDSPITRRTFIKRTTATVIVTALAIGAFVPEAFAQDAGPSSLETRYILELYTFGVPMVEVDSSGSTNLDENKHPWTTQPEVGANNAPKWRVQPAQADFDCFFDIPWRDGVGNKPINDGNGGAAQPAAYGFVQVRSRTLFPYTEIQHPKTGEWGYFGTTFSFAWLGLARIGVDQSGNANVRPVLEIPFTYQGTVTLPDIKKPDIEKVVQNKITLSTGYLACAGDNGFNGHAPWKQHFHVYYEVVLQGKEPAEPANDSEWEKVWVLSIRFWKAMPDTWNGNIWLPTPPPQNEVPAITKTFSDEFQWKKLDYTVPKE